MDMRDVPILQLSGPALDYAVAKAVGENVVVKGGEVLQPTPFGYGEVLVNGKHAGRGHGISICYQPSTAWAQGGPLIKQHEIGVVFARGYYTAEKWHASKIGGAAQTGLTPLIAAMRALVGAVQGGSSVAIPVELLEVAHDQ